MLLPLPASLLLLGAIRFSPESLPAHGPQETLVTVDRPGRVVLDARSPSGTGCELVDSLRGPIAHSGGAGDSNCEVDVLLDAGTYKLRLNSRPDGQGRVSLQGTSFSELNSHPVRLEPGREVRQPLAPRQQASFWIHLDTRRTVSVRVSGRTAGDARLWRNGEWMEPLAPSDTGAVPRSGQPIHEQWLEGTLDAGDYLLTAYGTDARRWTEGTEDNTLSVSYGFAPSRGSIAEVTLPVSGVAAVTLPPAPAALFLSRDTASKSSSSVTVYPLTTEGLGRNGTSEEGSCAIAPSERIPQCTARTRSSFKHVALLRGEPGTRLTLQWALLGEPRAPEAPPPASEAQEGDEEPRPESEENSEEPRSSEEEAPPPQEDAHRSPPPPVPNEPETPPDVYSEDALSPRFSVSKSGEYLVGLHEIPVDVDSTPMGCLLQEEQATGWRVVAQDTLTIGPAHPFRRQFNYDGRAATVWFTVERAGDYVVATGGERKNRCELFASTDAGMERVSTSQPKSQECHIAERLEPGVYELRLYGGTEGIEQLSLSTETNPPKVDSPARTSCLVPRVALKERTAYRLTANRSVAGSLRALVLRPLPLSLSAPLPVVLEGPSSRELPVEEGTQVEVLGPGSEAFSCARGGARTEAKEGHCRPSGSGATVTVSHAGDSAFTVWLHRSLPPVAEPPLSAYSPNLKPLKVLNPSTPEWFDFERDQRRAFTFEVKEPGLYHATTLGLLNTECSLRTAVLPSLEDTAAGGRGRNCLVSSFLRPGRYLLHVSTQGQSRGRAGVSIERREPVQAEDVRTPGEVFFRVAEGDLIQQRLTVAEAGPYTLSSAAQRASLRCRLDDAQGWPLLSVPTGCSQSLPLAVGTYVWTQLPLTVESMRRTAMERVLAPETLQGEDVHPLRFDTWYRAALGKDGQDAFTFEVPASMTVTFTLTNGIQGRLYAVGAQGEQRPVEVIPAREGYVPSPSSSSTVAGPMGPQSWPGPMPSGGTAVKLAPGRYQLVTEHYRGDVAISYFLYLRGDVMVPPGSWEVAVPGRVPLRLPVDGTLRLATHGNTDVRCRLLDEAGRLVAENADRGADWNCAIAEPIAAGEYTLVLESQAQQPGPTRVSVEMAPVTESGVLASGGKLDVGAAVVRASLPRGSADVLQDVALRAPEPFSCALEDARGAVVSRQVDVRECGMLLRPGTESWRVRVWTVGKPTQVSASVVTRAIRPLSGGAIAEGQAASAKVARPGRYETGSGVFCLPESEPGLLRPCGPEASLEAGAWVFSAMGTTGKAALSLTEKVDALSEPREERTRLEPWVALLRQHSPQPSLHLLKVEVPFGEPAYPACRLEGGVAQQRDFACFAATGAGQESLARWWTPARAPGEAVVTRFPVPVPSSTVPLTPGLQDVTWPGGPSVRLVLPGEPVRVKLSLPREAWAVQVDGKGAAVDLCSPSSALSRCVLSGEGGAVVIWSPAEARVQAEVLAVDSARHEAALADLFEAVYRMPSQQRLSLAPVKGESRLFVSGAVARCVLTLDDGMRLEGCDVKVPPGHGGELVADVDSGAVRAVLAAPANRVAATLAAPPDTKQPELPAAHALKLSGLGVERTFMVPAEALVHVRGDTGVCGLLQGGTALAEAGTDQGCSIDRLLKAGTYRLVVRAFAGQPLTGSVSWTHEPVPALAEGIAPKESWVAPGQTRFFRFDTTADGSIGLGLQVPAEVLTCHVFDAEQNLLGEGCQQFLSLKQGTYLLAIHAPPETARPIPFKPVLVGLSGTKSEIPETYLRDLFQRIGATP